MRILLSLAALLISTSFASAHAVLGQTSGFVHGFSHPLSGADHILAMVAVGMFAAGLGGRAIWAVPLTFMAVMAVGGGLGASGMPLPYVELGIALSVVVLGVAGATGSSLPLAAAMSLGGVFAIFHGHAHGTEMPADAAGASYAAGFVLATAALHLIGIGLGVSASAISRQSGDGRRITQAGGALISIFGVGILFGAI